jgi:N-Dimethylarginine dimethylaminohydrolase
VLDSEGGPGSIAYLPKAFDAASLAILEERFPDAIHVNDADAAVLGPELVQRRQERDHRLARHRLRPSAARARLHPHGVDLSELLLGGGGVKCCTLELRR